MKMIKFTDKELGVKLRAKVEYGNCAQLDKLRIAARQASIKLDIQEQQLAAAKAEIENQQAEIIRLKSVIQQAIDNFGYRTGKFDKLMSYAKQELEVRQLMDGLKDEE